MEGARYYEVRTSSGSPPRIGVVTSRNHLILMPTIMSTSNQKGYLVPDPNTWPVWKSVIEEKSIEDFRRVANVAENRPVRFDLRLWKPRQVCFLS